MRHRACPHDMRDSGIQYGPRFVARYVTRSQQQGCGRRRIGKCVRPENQHSRGQRIFQMVGPLFVDSGAIAAIFHVVAGEGEQRRMSKLIRSSADDRIRRERLPKMTGRFFEESEVGESPVRRPVPGPRSSERSWDPWMSRRGSPSRRPSRVANPVDPSPVGLPSS